MRVSAEPALMRRWFQDAAPVYVEGAWFRGNRSKVDRRTIIMLER